MLRRAHAAQRGMVVSVLSAFYDLFVGLSSFTAGWVAHRFGYSAAFLMAASALIAAGVAARFVFTAPINQARPEEALAEVSDVSK